MVFLKFGIGKFKTICTKNVFSSYDKRIKRTGKETLRIERKILKGGGTMERKRK